jgi:hypothetical protein
MRTRTYYFQIAELLSCNPYYGYRRICALLRIAGTPLPERVVRRELSAIRHVAVQQRLNVEE